MYKLLLVLLTSMTFATVSAKAPLETGVDNTYDYFALAKASLSSSVFQEIKGGQNRSDFDHCTQTCLDQFISCIATAQGTGQWLYCEMAFERCEAKCF